MGRTTRERRTHLGFARLTAGTLVVTAVSVVTPAPTAALVEEPSLSWARSAIAFDGESAGNAVAVDGTGAAVVTGTFENSITLGDGDRAVQLTSNGFDDLFVARYDADGRLDWALSVGSTSRDFGEAIDLDAAGNIYVAGEVFREALFDTVQVPAGTFVAKYDPSGALLWVRGVADLFGIGDLEVDSAGNAFLTGSYGRAITFRGGANEVTLTPRSFAPDVFVAAYTTDGDLAWAVDAGGIGDDRGAGIAVNDQGDVAVAGWFTGGADFGGAAGVVSLPDAADVGAFVAMYDAAGNAEWVRVGESVFAQARDVAIDETGQASLTGRFSGSVSFGGGPLTLTAPRFTTGVFLASFAADGTPSWVAGGTTDTGFPDGWSVVTDGTDVVIAGEFSGSTITFDDGSSSVTLDNVNSSPDAFVAGFTSVGAVSWAQAGGGAWNDQAYGVAIGAGSVTVTGQFQYTATFGTGADAVTLGSDTSNAAPMFLARYSTVGEAPSRIVLPSRLASTGSATVRVVGAGLVPGTAFELVGPGGEVLAPTGSVTASGQVAEARFDLSGAALGAWSVRLIVPGEGESLAGVITVVPPGAGDDDPVRLSLSVRDAVRVGRPFIATLTVFNMTDRDLAGVPLVLDGLPPGTIVEPEFPTFDLPDEPIPGLPPPPVPTELPPALTDVDGTVWYPLLTGRVPARGRVDLPVRVTVPPGTDGPVDVSLSGCSPGYTGTNDPQPPPASPEPDRISIACLKALYIEVVEQALEIVPGSGCVADGAKSYVAEQIVELMLHRALREAADADPGTAVSGTDVNEKITDLVASCLIEAIAVTKAARAAVAVWEIIRAVQDAEELVRTCLPPAPPSTRRINVVNSIDPNDKVGPDGAGPEGFTTPDVPFDYSIYFENLSTASAAAQRVVITDMIDTAVFDPNTIELGAITVANTIVAVPPPGVREWNDLVEFGHPDLLLGVDVAWDDATSTLTWTLDTIDRATGLPTDDPLAGFLPPNAEPPEGEGSVRFLIEPRTRVDGTQLRNEASIVFDTNEPIATGPWTNTLDGTAPASGVSPLPELTGSTAVPLSWSASDATSGVDRVEIWVQQDGGAPELWRTAVGEAITTATFEGVDGSTYAFWTRARDRAGNVEPPPGTPDTVTTIRVNQPPSAADHDVTTDQDTDVPITLTATDPDGDAITYEVVTPPVNGSLLGTPPHLVYRPAPGFTGTDSFTFRATDGMLTSSPATVTIQVVPRAVTDSISLDLAGRSNYRNAGDLLSGDFTIRRDQRGIAGVSGSGVIEGVAGGTADVSIEIRRLGRSKLYIGTVRIADAGAGPGGLTWTGRVLGAFVAAGPNSAAGVALATAITRPHGLHVLSWQVTDGQAPAS